MTKAHQWESNYDLDPSLDPGVELPSNSNTTELLTPWLTLTNGSSVQTHTSTPAKSPHRKANMLAIDEAQSLIVKGKRRRKVALSGRNLCYFPTGMYKEL